MGLGWWVGRTGAAGVFKRAVPAVLPPIPPLLTQVLPARPPRPPPTHAGTRQECEAELAALDRTIAAKEEELAGVQRRLATAAERAASLVAELEGKERRLKALYEKQGRGAQVGGASGVGRCAGLLWRGLLLSSPCWPHSLERLPTRSPATAAAKQPPSATATPAPQFNSEAERDEWCRQEAAQLRATVAQKKENQRGAQQQLAAAQAEAEEVRRRGGLRAPAGAGRGCACVPGRLWLRPTQPLSRSPTHPTPALHPSAGGGAGGGGAGRAGRARRGRHR